MERWRSILPLLMVAIVLAGCSLAQLRPTPHSFANCLQSAPAPKDVTGVFVAPDDRLAPIIDELNAAVCTIDVSVYLLTADAVISALARAVDRGVRVRVMLEEHPFGGGGTQDESRAELESLGIEVRWSGSEFRFSHAKFIVVDGRVAMIMNQNLTESAFVSNREFGVVTTFPDVVRQAQAIFDLDWDGTATESSGGPLIVSPVDSRSRFVQLINEASSSIDFYAEVIRDVDIVEALAQAESRGVSIRLIVDVSIDEDSDDALNVLAGSGVEIRHANHLYIHAKLMIVDGTSAVVGSQNFTQTSLDQNRELAMVVNEPQLLARCAAVFERDWLRSVPAGEFGAVPQGAGMRAIPLAVPAVENAGEPVPLVTYHDIPFDISNSIVGPVRGSVGEALRFAEAAGAHRLDDVEMYIREIYRLAPALGFDPAILIAQSNLETDSWRSIWWTARLNPAGIGVTGFPDQDTVSPTFPDGVAAARAQLAHMHAGVFGASRPLPVDLRGLDPRYQIVFDAGIAGTVHTISDLAGTWAVDPDYASKIVVRARAIFP